MIRSKDTGLGANKAIGLGYQVINSDDKMKTSKLKEGSLKVNSSHVQGTVWGVRYWRLMQLPAQKELPGKSEWGEEIPFFSWGHSERDTIQVNV